jgi:hypothetical protein
MRYTYDKNEACIREGYAVSGNSSNPIQSNRPMQNNIESNEN